MPDHIKFLLRHAVFGAVIAVAFVGALLAMNVANMRHLVLNTADGPLALAVMTVFFWITFASVQIGIRIMMMAGDDNQDGGTRAPEPLTLPIPVRTNDR